MFATNLSKYLLKRELFPHSSLVSWLLRQGWLENCPSIRYTFWSIALVKQTKKSFTEVEVIKIAVKYCVMSCFVSSPLLTTPCRRQEPNFPSLPILTFLFLNTDFSRVTHLPSSKGQIWLPLELSELLKQKCNRF